MAAIRAFADRWGFDLAWLPGIEAGEANRHHVLDTPAFLEVSRAVLAGGVAPPGAARLAATARLSPGMERWGDFELVVRVDDREAFRTTINGLQREADFNVALDGTELTIEITEAKIGR